MLKPVKRAEHNVHPHWKFNKLIANAMAMMMPAVSSNLEAMPRSEKLYYAQLKIKVRFGSPDIFFLVFYLVMQFLVPSMVQTVFGRGQPFL